MGSFHNFIPKSLLLLKDLEAQCKETKFIYYHNGFWRINSLLYVHAAQHLMQKRMYAFYSDYIRFC